MQLEDLISLKELDQAISDGLVRVQAHPTAPLFIYNYTNAAQVGHKWNPVTRTCRGLIVHENGDVVARPFPKFFNYGEESAKDRKWLDNETVSVTDKMDGSLGILYHDGDGWAIATRGSFTSSQALWATEFFNYHYGDFEPYSDLTYLFEIIYPENRIVVNYGETQDLVLIGGVQKYNGLNVPPNQVKEWPGPKAKTFGYRSLSEALSAPPRDNAEGLVVHFRESDERVKIKQEDYVRLHRIVTGLNRKSVWEYLWQHGEVESLADQVPEEFSNWIFLTANNLKDAFYAKQVQAVKLFASLPKNDRKEFALAIKDEEPWLKACLFGQLDGKDNRHVIWKNIMPKGDS